MKKVALVGNMNNNFFSIARHLRDHGFDAHLFYNAQILGQHFHPHADTLKLNDLKFVHTVNWFKTSFYDGRIEDVQRDLAGFDLYIAQGDEAAMMAKAGFKIDVYYPYGSDIYKYAWLRKEFKTWEVLAAKWLNRPKFTLPYEGMKDGTMTKFLVQAIQNARHVFWDYANEEVDKKLFAIGLKGELHRVPMPFIYPDTYREHFSSSRNSDTHWASEIDRLRQENDFLLLYHGRQEWKTHWNDFTNKNTHHLIHGFAQFLNEKPANIKAHLIMLEYGGDWQNSVELVKEIGIESSVTWLPKMLRKDLFYIISQMDLCSGEFDKSYLSFGTIMEAMCMGKPVIHYRNDELYKGTYPTLYPMVHAREIAEVKTQLMHYCTRKEELQKMGQEAQKWVDTYFIEGPVKALVDVLNRS